MAAKNFDEWYSTPFNVAGGNEETASVIKYWCRASWDAATVSAEEKILQSASPTNIDYTAVLSEALSFVVSIQKCGYVEKHIPEVAAHLNAAIHKQHCV